MRYYLILFITFLTTGIYRGYCQSPEPLKLAQLIFAKDSFPELSKYSTGEYKGKPNGRDLSDSSLRRFELLMKDSNKAVVVMTVVSSLDTTKGIDTYLYFQRDSIWKMSAFRALAMTGILEDMKNMLEKLTPQEVDEIIKKSKKDKKEKYYGFTTREEYQFELGNVRLTLDLDKNIIQHFKNNRTEFERLKELALGEAANKKKDDERSVSLLEKYNKDYRKLFISSVSYSDYDLGENVLSFLIGGMLDNTVGYLYVKDKKDLPAISADRIIMIREIGDGWYLYKTT